MHIFASFSVHRLWGRVRRVPYFESAWFAQEQRCAFPQPRWLTVVSPDVKIRLSDSPREWAHDIKKVLPMPKLDKFSSREHLHAAPFHEFNVNKRFYTGCLYLHPSTSSVGSQHEIIVTVFLLYYRPDYKGGHWYAPSFELWFHVTQMTRICYLICYYYYAYYLLLRPEFSEEYNKMRLVDGWIGFHPTYGFPW